MKRCIPFIVIVSIFCLYACSKIDDSWISGYQHRIDYIPTRTDIPSSITITYAATFRMKMPQMNTLTISTTGIVSSPIITTTYGPIEYMMENQVPLTVNIHGKGIGTLLVSQSLPSALQPNTLQIGVGILMTDEGITIGEDIVSAYKHYLEQRRDRGIITDQDIDRLMSTVSTTKQITVLIDGKPTTFRIN